MLDEGGPEKASLTATTAAMRVGSSRFVTSHRRPVVDKSHYQIAMFGQRHEKEENLRFFKLPSPYIFYKDFFKTWSEHRNLVTRFLHDGDVDSDVTNLKLPNTYYWFLQSCEIALRTLKF